MRAGRLNNGTFCHGTEAGSALILTVVLTSLLAIVGVLFMMVTRIDKMGTVATSDNQELTMAVDTLVAEISELLAQDVPGAVGGPEYYDFPDVNDPWLADLEPYSDGVYRWRQISSIAGPTTSATRDVLIRVIGERDPIVDINDANNVVTTADADGDGVGDARWFAIPGVVSGRGRTIYGAVRIIDNGGMLNVNTGFWFDPNRADLSFSDPSHTEASDVDGSSPLQINAIALSSGYDVGGSSSMSHAADLLDARGIDPNVGLSDYEDAVVWGYSRRDPRNPFAWYAFTPFDLSDELELRYRGLINHGGVDTRVENWGRFRAGTISTPVDSGGQELDRWFARARDAGGLDPNYACRHVATAYNMDRIITPEPLGAGLRNKKVNVHNTPKGAIHEAVLAALPKRGRDPVQVWDEAAQITANIVDYIDDDDEVTTVDGASASGSRYYGFERPCIYISEIAHNAVTDGFGVVHRSFAVELYKPYFEDDDPVDEQWRLVIETAGTNPIQQPIVWSGLRRFHVLVFEDPLAELFDDSLFDDPEEPADAAERFGYDRTYATPMAQPLDSRGFGEGARFSLERWVTEAQEWLSVDNVRVATDGWMDPDQGPRSSQRDISPYKCARRLWTPTGVTPVGLGNGIGQFVDPNDGLLQAHPANRSLRNIGELGMVFARSAYGVEPSDNAAENLLLNLADPHYARLFNYLTVIDPTNHGHALDETRIMGRINVNTAPWFVLAQLPWIQYQDSSPAKSTRAQAIVARRETFGPFRSIGELMRVGALHDLALDGRDNLNDESPERGPDLTRDGARDDLEERDLLFTRMSNLVTVRSDVFTAYILVRIGVNGPQKRMIAILDRSETTEANPAVRVVALHPVADPR